VHTEALKAIDTKKEHGNHHQMQRATTAFYSENIKFTENIVTLNNKILSALSTRVLVSRPAFK